jgi:argininosuccinate lyase
VPATFINSFQIDRRLFRAEIRASLAHADGLFRAGILTRQENERIKNGLWTILKRADFDRHYFDALPSTDVFAFVEARLFQLINDGAAKLKIGRSVEHQTAIALRIWLRDEILFVVERLEHLEEILQSSNNPVFAAFFEMFDRDREIFGEVLLRANRLPHVEIAPQTDESLTEIDFPEIARDLGFASVTHNALESASDRDFCLEFVGAASFVMLHLARLANEVLNNFPNLSANVQSAFETMRGKSGKIFGNQTALLSLLKSSPLGVTKDLQEINPIVFETADTIKDCLQMTGNVLDSFNSLSVIKR